MNAPLVLEPQRIDRAGLYDIAADVYHADPVIEPSASASILKLGSKKSAAHMRIAHPRLDPAFERQHKTHFDIGTAVHDLMLEGAERFAIIEADDYKTKAAQAAKALAYAENLTPLLVHQYEQAQAMVAACRAQILRLTNPEDRQAFQGGKPEQTLVWQEGGTWCRALLDWLPAGGNVFHDLKTTGTTANPDEWGQRTLFDIGADIQAVMHSRGIRAVLGITNPIFRFIVLEDEPPYALSVVELAPEAVDSAERETERALALWRWCLKHNHWPGYAPHVHYVSPPPWVSIRREDRLSREKVLADMGELERMLEWQAPLEEETA